jgi:hypothetical protein
VHETYLVGIVGYVAARLRSRFTSLRKRSKRPHQG